jgi:hypothetical protein
VWISDGGNGFARYRESGNLRQHEKRSIFRASFSPFFWRSREFGRSLWKEHLHTAQHRTRLVIQLAQSILLGIIESVDRARATLLRISSEFDLREGIVH